MATRAKKVSRPVWEAWIVAPETLGFERRGFAKTKTEAWKIAVASARLVKAKEFYVVSPTGKEYWYRTSKESRS